MTQQRINEDMIKRLDGRVKRQDEYLNRVLQLLVKLLARLTALESASV